MRLYRFTVVFKAKDQHGKLYPMAHTEDVITDTHEHAIQRAFKQVPLDQLRRPIVSAEAFRDMTR